MTTKVTIEVPETAGYRAIVITDGYANDANGPYRVYDEYQVLPGDSLTVYIHAGLSIESIREVLLVEPEFLEDYLYEECYPEGE